MRPLLICAVAALVGCGGFSSASSAHAPTSAIVATAARTPIVFMNDDFEAAIAKAKKLDKPIFVDAWATWCHTCLSMREFVFTDPALEPLANDFVWLAIDTEKPENAAFVEQYPMRVWPTLWVIDATTRKSALQWLGSLTSAELVSLLGDAKSAVRQRDQGGEAGAAFIRGNQASAAGKMDEAIDAYRAALAQAPPGWDKRARVVEAIVARLAERKDYDGCVDVALRELERIAPGTSASNVMITSMHCALLAPEGSRTRASLAFFQAAAERAAADRAFPVLPDDRSALYDEIVSVLKETHEDARAKRVAEAWAAYLDEQAKAAPTPEARAVFDYHRLVAYSTIGHAERALPILAASAHDFPTDYNPPARQAIAYLELKRYDEGIAASDRALALVYGPRKLRVLAVKCDLQMAKGDSEAARTTLKQAVALSRTMTLPGSYANFREQLEKRLRAMDSTR